MSTCIVTKRVLELEATDSMLYTNATGSKILCNQLITIAGDSGFGVVAIALEDIANGDTGAVMTKGVVQLPAAATAMTQGQTAQYAPTAASVSVAGTATGTYAVGMVRDTIASSAGYVNVDLNFGPQAFKVW